MSRRRSTFVLALVVLVAIACLGIAALLDLRAALVGYLAVAVAVSAIPTGALAVLMITYLVRGSWTQALHVPLAAAALTMPLAGVLFVPVLIGVPWLYPWAQDADLHGFRAFYLAPGAFVLRTIIYFVIWSALAIWTRASWAEPRRMLAAASAGLIVYALTASLAGVDWLESLTPEFHSSIYGLLFLTFQMLTGLAFALVIALWPAGAPTFRYGAILLSVLLLWAYIHAMQYIVIWTGNIPDEVAWYLARESGVWGVLLWTLIILQFVVPFFAMLLERVRNGRAPLLSIALLTLAMRLLEAVVLAAPGADVSGSVLLLAVPAATASVGLLWWFGFRIALEQLRSNERDTAPLPDVFDAAGTPTSQPRA